MIGPGVTAGGNVCPDGRTALNELEHGARALYFNDPIVEERAQARRAMGSG
jgi:hypothetical protein